MTKPQYVHGRFVCHKDHIPAHKGILSEMAFDGEIANFEQWLDEQLEEEKEIAESPDSLMKQDFAAGAAWALRQVRKKLFGE